MFYSTLDRTRLITRHSNPNGVSIAAKFKIGAVSCAGKQANVIPILRAMLQKRSKVKGHSAVARQSLCGRHRDVHRRQFARACSENHLNGLDGPKLLAADPLKLQRRQ